MAHQPNAPPAESLDHFQQTPGFANLLASPLYHAVPPFEHADGIQAPNGDLQNALFQRTFRTLESIAHCISLSLVTVPEPPAAIPGTDVDIGPPHHMYLIAFGSAGISGRPGKAHGGALSALLEEVAWTCSEREQQRCGSQATRVGVRLEVEFKKPVNVPGDYLVRAWVAAKERRKLWIKGQIVSPDGQEMCVEGMALSIESRASL